MIQRDKIFAQLHANRDRFSEFAGSYQDESRQYREAIDRLSAIPRAELNQRGLRNVHVVNADALKTGLEKKSYDVVHERLVLINLPLVTQEAILAELLSLLKPGGTIALQEYDSSSYICYPDHPSWNILLGVASDTFRAAGGNELIGVLWRTCCSPRARKTWRWRLTSDSPKSANTSAPICWL